MRESLSPRERIRAKRDFSFLYKEGLRYRGKYFNLVFLANQQSFSRMAVVVSRKVGGAAERNRIKRWMRELFRRNKSLLETPLDMIFVIKKEITDSTWTGLKVEYFSALEAISRRVLA